MLLSKPPTGLASGHPGVDVFPPAYPPVQGGVMEHSMGSICVLLEDPLLCTPSWEYAEGAGDVAWT